MSVASYRDQIIREIDIIPSANLGQLAELIHYYRIGLQHEVRPPAGPRRFSDLCGVLSDEEADAMLVAIEEAFERIDEDAW